MTSPSNSDEIPQTKDDMVRWLRDRNIDEVECLVPDQTGMMRGLVTTLAKNNATIAPVSAPIIYGRLEDPDAAAFGEITPGDAAYREYHETIRDAVYKGYCTVIRP